MAYYVIATSNITNSDWTEEYTLEVSKLVEKYDGKYLVRTTNVDLIEGEGAAPEVVVVLQFPTKEAYFELYNSEEYKPYLHARRAGSEGRILMVALEDQVK